MQSVLWGDYLLAFLVALLGSYLLTPAVRGMAIRFGAVDQPNARKVHDTPIPRWGGIAIYLSFFGAMLLIYLVSRHHDLLFPLRHRSPLLGIAVVGTLLFLLGIVDDKRDLPAKLKLAIHLAAGGLLYAVFDLKIDYISNPFGRLINTPAPVDFLLTLLWVAGITNALNLLDGLDGLLAGVSAISALIFFAVALIHKQYFAALLLAALAGSTIGFLRYNFHPARIFMGDAGSQFLGIVWACVSIQGGLKVPTMTVMIPVLILGLPIVDTFSAILRRFVKGRPIFQADKEHLHHQLLGLGLTQRQAVGLLYALAAFMGSLALFLSGRP